jgi:hypothetical protein
MTLRIHNFAESLEVSHLYSNAAWWGVVYKAAFPSLDAMTCVRSDGWAQRGGIDRILTLKSGRVIKIDEKVRSKWYGDILLERFSDEARKIAGWIQKPLDCEFIAYAVVPIETCWLLPTLQLQQAWRCFGREWIKRYPKEIRAHNSSYITLSTAVPPDVLVAGIADVARIAWNAPVASMPVDNLAVPSNPQRQLALPLVIPGKAAP